MVVDEGCVMVLNGEIDLFVLVFSVDGKLFYNFKVILLFLDSGIVMMFYKISEIVLVVFF